MSFFLFNIRKLLLTPIWSAASFVRYKKRKSKGPTILIYTMGKVGTISLHKSLEKHHRGPVVTTHLLDENQPIYSVRETSRGLRSNPDLPLLVISPVRRPMERNKSAFFQGLSSFMLNQSLKLDYLKHRFLMSFPHQFPLQWHQYYIQRDLGIDVYSEPFPEKGYIILRNRNISLLIYRAELPMQEQESIIGEFTGIQDFTFNLRNVGSKKSSGGLYQEFKCIEMPMELSATLENSRYFKHFYGDETNAEKSCEPQAAMT